MSEFKDGKLKTPNGEVVTDKNQALAVLLTKLSSARENSLLMDNYAVKALRTFILDFKESNSKSLTLEMKRRVSRKIHPFLLQQVCIIFLGASFHFQFKILYIVLNEILKLYFT